MPLTYMDVRPRPSSQTTSVKVENLAIEDSINFAFFDTTSPTIQSPARSSWEEAASEVLKEHAELWERLSRL